MTTEEYYNELLATPVVRESTRLKCRYAPQYRGTKRPRCQCMTCWMVWFKEELIRVRAGTLVPRRRRRRVQASY